MGITDGYATLAQFKALPDITSTDASDDSFLEDLITRTSRDIDSYCGGRTFFARTSVTRNYSVPPDGDRQLDLDDDLLSLTTLTNGDDVAIASTEYHLLSKNDPPYYAILLKESSTEIWEPDNDGNTEYVIDVLGTYGYIDRAGTDKRTLRVIADTENACLLIALSQWKKRYGKNVEGVARVTSAGVVITPSGWPKEALDKLEPYRKRP